MKKMPIIKWETPKVEYTFHCTNYSTHTDVQEITQLQQVQGDEETYSESSLILHNLFPNYGGVWRINWIFITLCMLYCYWGIVVD